MHIQGCNLKRFHVYATAIEAVFDCNSQKYQRALHDQNISNSQDMKPSTEWFIHRRTHAHLRNAVDRTSLNCLINFGFRISPLRNNPCSSIN